MLTQHLADCLAIVTPLARRLSHGRLLDVGSGGGLPGVVVAIMAPGVEVTCVDGVAKKAAFVRHVAGVLGLTNLGSAHAKVEMLDLPPFDVIASRAFADLPRFVELTRKLMPPGGAWLAMKGKEPAEEIAALPPDIDVFHVEPLSVPGMVAQRCLVWMRPHAKG